MNRRLAAMLACALAGVGVATAEDPARGREVDFPWPGLINPLRVYLPENYSELRKWPVIFHYHGSGGKPTTAIPRSYTGGRDFVIVGMEYCSAGGVPDGARDYLEAELELLRDVRAALARKLRLNVERSYVGGFSKGGWFAAEFAESHMEEFAGAYILGAGKRRPDKRPTIPIDDNPVYVGVGQNDPNFPFGLAAREHFRALGARVTFEEFLGRGHRVPGDHRFAPYFAQWWRIEAAESGVAASPRADANAWIARCIARAEAQSNPIDRVLILDHTRLAPFADAASKPARIALDAACAEVAKNPALQTELAARTRYRAAVAREAGGFGIAHLRDVIDDYVAIHESAPKTWFGRRAGRAVARIRKQILDTRNWRWPDEAARRKFADDLAANPLPDAPTDDSAEEFLRVRDLLADPASNAK